MMTRMFLLWLPAVLCARADLIVAPNDRATQSGNTFTLNGFRTPSTYQNVYGSRNFSSPVLINSISFRQDEGSGGMSFDAVIPRIQIRISTYSGTFASFASNPFAYDDNKGPDDFTAFDGSVHWNTTDLGGSVPNPFDLKIHFSRPFLYDPTKGSLLINYSSSGDFTSGLVPDSHGHGDPTIGWSGGNELGNLVTQFDVTPVPEPSLLALIALAVPVVLATRKRQ